jgi:hypothetical protein
VNHKSLTYFLIVVFLISAGVVFSKSVLETRSASIAERILHKVTGETLFDFSIDEQTDFPNTLKTITDNPYTPTGLTSNYFHKNYILLRIHFLDREDTRRTNLWFTSLIRN